MPKDTFDRLKEKNITFHWADLVRYEARGDYKKSIGKLGEGLKTAVELYRDGKVKPVRVTLRNSDRVLSNTACRG